VGGTVDEAGRQGRSSNGPLAEASRARHIAEAAEMAKYGKLKEGFHAESTLTELMNWWLERIARHRVRGTTFATYRKQLKQVEDRIGGLVVRTLRPEQLTTLMSDLVDAGSASRARTSERCSSRYSAKPRTSAWCPRTSLARFGRRECRASPAAR
jgi:hypothetical protein